MKQYTIKEFIKILVYNNFHLVRTKGSHYIYYNNNGKHISVPRVLNSCIARRLIKENNLITRNN
jgi:predicted RNA binding protein YcfA (HicA-like mRNA interferase family)